MRSKIFLLATLLFPALSYACPNLAGTYSCRYGIFSKQIEVTQYDRGGVTTYQVDGGGEISADGIRHQTPNLHPLLDRHARNYSYIANCSGDRLDFEGVADLVRGGQGDVQGELIKHGSDLTIHMVLVTPDKTRDITLDCSPR
ncbi:MAG: hypothetical protein AB7F86_14375 [Bdellovibrionales bacterium]